MCLFILFIYELENCDLCEDLGLITFLMVGFCSSNWPIWCSTLCFNFGFDNSHTTRDSAGNGWLLCKHDSGLFAVIFGPKFTRKFMQIRFLMLSLLI